MRLARPAAILVLGCALALALAGCGPSAGTSAPAPATSAATLAGTAPSRPASSHPTSPPAASSRSPHSAPGRSSLPSARTVPRYRASASAAIHADHVVGHGTPGSCTSQAVVQAVAAGGVIAFSCGPRPVTIVMTATAKVRNTSAAFVLDGGGLVTLSGGGVRRILYMDTCDPAQTWTTSHCQDQATPALTVENSTFTGGVCSNGGALSSIGVSWVVQDSTFTGNRAIGDGANPAQAGTPGGGSGGAIYTDGNDYTVTVDGSVITANSAREGGGALFFVSNDKTGTLTIEHSKLRDNPNAGFQTAGYLGIFFLGQGHPVVLSSSLS
jgi:hypothetical protein